MKKKILLILLVVLMVGILACTAFACKPKTPPKDSKDDGKQETPDLTGAAITDLLAGMDKDISNLLAISKTQKGYVEATIALKLEIGKDLGVLTDDKLDVKLRVGASLDNEDPDNNIAVIEVLDSGDGDLYCCLFVKGDVIYIGQDALGSSVTWTKLSQAQGAGFSAFVVDKVIELLTFGTDTDWTVIAYEYQKDAEGKFILDENGEKIFKLNNKGEKIVDAKATKTYQKNSLLTTMLGSTIVDLIGSFSLFNTTQTTNGYDLQINLNMIGTLLDGVSGLLPGLKNDKGEIDLAGLLGEYGDVANFAVELLLGGASIDELISGNVDVADMPEIKIGFEFDSAKALSDLILSYNGKVKGTDIKFSFAIEDLKVSSNSYAGLLPSYDSANKFAVNKAEELALDLSLDLKVPGKDVDATINCVVYPDVALSFDTAPGATMYDEDENKLVADTTKWVGIDFLGLKGYATITDNTEGANAPETLIATYQSSDKGFYVDLAAVYAALGQAVPTDPTHYNGTKFFIPLDAQTMFNDYIAGEVAKRQTKQDELFAEAPAGASNATDFKKLIEGITKGDDDGKFVIGDLLGNIGGVVDLLDTTIMPLLFNGEANGITFTKGNNFTGSLVLAIDALMDFLNADDMLGQTLKILGKNMNIADDYTGDEAILPALAEAFGLVEKVELEETAPGYAAAVAAAKSAGVDKLIAVVFGFTGYTIGDPEDPYDGLSFSLAYSDVSADASALEIVIADSDIEGTDKTIVSVKLTLGIKGEDNRVMPSQADRDALKAGAKATYGNEDAATDTAHTEALYNLLKNLFNQFMADELDMDMDLVDITPAE